MRLLPGKIFFDIFLLAAACGAFAMSRSLPTSSGIGSIGAADFPLVISGLSIAVMLAILWQDLRSPAVEDDDETRIGWIGFAALAAMAIWLGLYIYLFERLGFVPTTFGFLTLSILTCGWAFTAPGNRSDWVRLGGMAALIGAVATGLALLVFSYGFGLIFP